VKGKDFVTYCVMAGLLSPYAALDLAHQPKPWTLGIAMASSTSGVVKSIHLVTGQPIIPVYGDYRPITVVPSST
jgi:hypothetical protein